MKKMFKKRSKVEYEYYEDVYLYELFISLVSVVS